MVSFDARLAALERRLTVRGAVSPEEIAARRAAFDESWPQVAAMLTETLENHLEGLEPEEQARRVAEWEAFYRSATRP